MSEQPGDPTPAERAADPGAIGGQRPVDPEHAHDEGIWERFSRGASHVIHPDVPAEAPHVVVAVPPSDPARLLRESPFSIGFYGTLGALVAFGVATVLMQLQWIILIVGVSLFLALGLNPLVERITGWGLPRWAAVTSVMLVAVAIVGLGSWAVVPMFSQQINALIENAPAYLEQLRANPTLHRLDEQYEIIRKAQDYLTSGALLDTLFGGLVGAGRLVANVVSSVVVTLVLTIYFLVSLPTIKQAIYQLAPASRRERATYVADQMFSRVGSYLSGMFLIVTIASSAAFVFMMFVGLAPYALALAFVVLVFAFIPLVGSSISMLIVAAVGFTLSPTTGIAVIVYFLVYQQFEAYVIGPRIMARNVKVPGAIVVVAALSGGVLLGIIGALLAIPIAASLLLLYEEVVVPRLDAS